MRQLIELAMNETIKAFKAPKENFFTEHDIVCYFYSRLIKRGLSHRLIHLEYPTGFRCDMKNYNFSRKKDKETGYRRGHYDLVILDKNNMRGDFWEKSSQEFTAIEHLSQKERNAKILYGFEFMYHRQPLGFTGAESYCKRVKQDYDKLVEIGKNKAEVLVFFREIDDFALDKIKKEYIRNKNIHIIARKPEDEKE